MIEQTITLNSGHKMPILGLGTWKTSPEQAAAVEYALTEAGYRHVDCAPIYGNESEIGQSFKKLFSSGKVKREEVFITSKLYNDTHGKDQVLTACKQTLKDLQLDYLDLYLMHWGFAEPKHKSNAERVDKDGFVIIDNISIRETWEAMEELVKAGLVRSVGVSNFTGAQLMDLMTYAKIKPAINQIELHPYLQQNNLVEYMRHLGIAATAYMPAGSPGVVAARNANEPILIKDPVINEIATQHGKSVQQILMRWGIQRGTIVIPKSVNPEHLKNNIDIFNFELTNEDMDRIASLERGYRFNNPNRWGKIAYFE